MQHNGTLRILRLGEQPGTKLTTFSVTYAPYRGRGGALKSHPCQGEQELRNLLSEMAIDQESIDNALNDLRRLGRALIPNVQLSDEQINRYERK